MSFQGSRKDVVCRQNLRYNEAPAGWPLKILMVEDDRHLRTLYREEMEEEGYEVYTAATGAEAWDLFVALKPDFVTMDIKLPDADGTALLKKMRESRPGLRAVLLTAYDFFDDSSMWVSKDYLVKSSDLSELKTRVRETLSDP